MMGIKLTSQQRKALNLPPAPSKYGNTRVQRDGITFDSKREAERYDQLVLLKQAGEVLWFLRQPSFDLEGGVKYRADFLVVWADGRVTVEDVKGMVTPIYALKRKQMKARWGVEIVEI